MELQAQLAAPTAVMQARWRVEVRRRPAAAAPPPPRTVDEHGLIGWLWRGGADPRQELPGTVEVRFEAKIGQRWMPMPFLTVPAAVSIAAQP